MHMSCWGDVIGLSESCGTCDEGHTLSGSMRFNARFCKRHRSFSVDSSRLYAIPRRHVQVLTNRSQSGFYATGHFAHLGIAHNERSFEYRVINHTEHAQKHNRFPPMVLLKRGLMIPQSLDWHACVVDGRAHMPVLLSVCPDTLVIDQSDLRCIELKDAIVKTEAVSGHPGGHHVHAIEADMLLNVDDVCKLVVTDPTPPPSPPNEVKQQDQRHIGHDRPAATTHSLELTTHAPLYTMTGFSIFRTLLAHMHRLPRLYVVLLLGFMVMHSLYVHTAVRAIAWT